MADINLSHAVRSNLLSLQSTAANMAKTQERLASGLKVNSALDNPTNFFTAAALNSRAGDMANLLDSMSSGIKTIEAADNGIKSIVKTVETMQSTLRQARQDKSFKSASYTIDAAATGNISFSRGAVGTPAETVGLVKNVVVGNGGFSSSTRTAGANGTLAITSSSLNGGAAVNVTFAAGDDAAAVAAKINGALNGLTSGNGGITASVNNGQLQLSNATGNTMTLAGGQLIGLTAGAAVDNTDSTIVGAGNNSGAGAGGVLTVAGVPVTIAAGTGTAATDGANAASAINSALSAAGVTGIVASANGTGTLTITRESGEAVTISGSNALLTELGMTAGAVTSITSSNGIFDLPLVSAVASSNMVKTVDELVAEINHQPGLIDKVRASNDNGKLRVENLSTSEMTVGGVAINGTVTGGVTSVEIGRNDVRRNLVTQFNELRDQLDKFSDDASFNGINLLRGDKLKLTFNETGTSTIEIEAKDEVGNPTAINNTSLGINLAVEADFDSDATLDSMLSDLKGSLDYLRSQASSFGSNLSVVQNRTDFTKNMINTLETGAANLTLADTNEEAANLLALQTRQQLSSTALSMASQADQAVLRLF